MAFKEWLVHKPNRALLGVVGRLPYESPSNLKNHLKHGPEPPQKQARIKSKSIQKVRQEMSSNGQNLGEL